MITHHKVLKVFKEVSSVFNYLEGEMFSDLFCDTFFEDELENKKTDNKQ